MSGLRIVHGCATNQLVQDRNTLIDAADYPLLRQKDWRVARCGDRFYAVGTLWSDGKASSLYLNRAIAEMAEGERSPGVEVDHQNRGSSDNRCDNLRPATKSRNRCNARKKLWRGAAASLRDFKAVDWHSTIRSGLPRSRSAESNTISAWLIPRWTRPGPTMRRPARYLASLLA